MHSEVSLRSEGEQVAFKGAFVLFHFDKSQNITIQYVHPALWMTRVHGIGCYRYSIVLPAREHN